MAKAAPYHLTWIHEQNIYALHDNSSERVLSMTQDTQEWFTLLAHLLLRSARSTHGPQGDQAERGSVLVRLPENRQEDGQEIPGPDSRTHPCSLRGGRSRDHDLFYIPLQTGATCQLPVVRTDLSKSAGLLFFSCFLQRECGDSKHSQVQARVEDARLPHSFRRSATGGSCH